MAWLGSGMKLMYKEFVFTLVQSNHTQEKFKVI